MPMVHQRRRQTDGQLTVAIPRYARLHFAVKWVGIAADVTL